MVVILNNTLDLSIMLIKPLFNLLEISFIMFIVQASLKVITYDLYLLTYYVYNAIGANLLKLFTAVT
jgi:hypothetical protein